MMERIRTSRPALDPPLGDGVGDREGAAQNDICNGVEAVQRQIFRAADEVAGGIVYETGQRPPCLPDVVDEFVNRIRRADVARIGPDGGAVGLRELVGGLLEHRLAASADDDVGAERGKARGHLAAQPGAAPRDENPFALQQIGPEHRAPC